MIPPISLGVLRYDTSGTNGSHGANGPRGCSRGGRGNDGAAGAHGRHAGNLNVTLAATDGRVSVQTHKRLNQFPLSDRTSTIFLKARGGDAGNGGNGGAGGKGYTGRDGADATRYYWGSDGKSGGPGGCGGNGAHGGDGGNGGNVILCVKPEDADLLMLTNIPDVQGGAKGQRGAGGPGGSGGDGGQGGDSHYWTTTHSRSTSDGQGGTHTEWYKKSHCNPGGSDGATGPRGSSGKDASNGNSGRCGSFNINVGRNTYKGPYDLSVVSCNLTDYNHDNVIEPGENMSVELTVQNIGKMPTPKNQVIRLPDYHRPYVVSQLL